MKPEDRDQAHLWDMLQAADEVRERALGEPSPVAVTPN
jgi:hypothetical protein